MKNIKSNPKNKEFFSIYASLIANLKKAGYASQVVSGLTEVGGIFAAAYAALLPVIPALAIYAAVAIAIIGTAVIELGLRKVLPHTVDSILYGRWSGLYLPMSIFIWLSAIVLVGASGILSFQNSKNIVQEVTPDAVKDTTAIALADSTFNAALLSLDARYNSSKQEIENRYTNLLASNSAAFDGKIKAKRRDYSNLRNKEIRTSRSYATAKDRIKADIARLEAEQAGEHSQLESKKATELAVLSQENKATVAKQTKLYEDEKGAIESAYQEAKGERAAKVATWGGGLAWFTIVALIVLIVSIILDRIHVKGSEINEDVVQSQADISPSTWSERWHAWRERRYNKSMIKIAQYRAKTPPPPMPVAPAAIYDPTVLANKEAKIEMEDEEDGIIHIKRRQIGFDMTHQSGDLLGTRKAQQKEKETPGAGTDIKMWKKRLKQYQRRLGVQRKKERQQMRTDGVVNQRTLNAIKNNEQWVAHYEQLIAKAENQK